jgi:hypothetical protein
MFSPQVPICPPKFQIQALANVVLGQKYRNGPLPVIFSPRPVSILLAISVDPNSYQKLFVVSLRKITFNL